MLRTLVLTAALVLAAGTFAPDAQAQMSKDDIIKGLKPSQPVTRSVRTRAIEVIPGKEAEVIDQNKDLPKINLTIEFEYDSDRPTRAGERQLATLSEALKDPNLNGFRFLLAGHTDARGPPDYNQRLSERRAAAVQRYLAGTKIDPEKIKIVGFGKTRLLDEKQPDSPRNRRVEIVNLLN
jgi:outer membrane protein OmpA-like peptidoglycan-associated protein